MYKLKTAARRSAMLGLTASFLVATLAPSIAVFAQSSLTPLTERSLLLSSSAPGFVDTDGSGYSTGSPNPAANPPGTPTSYAPAGSGPNGKKSGQTFSFRLSTGGTHKGFSFQYCTSAAGNCQAPGNNNEAHPDYTPGPTANDAGQPGDFRNGGELDPGDPLKEDGRAANVMASPNEALGGHVNNKSDLDFVGTFAAAGSAANEAAMTPGQFQIFRSANGTSWTAVDTTGWTFEKANLEDTGHTKVLTGKNNYVTLSDTTGDAGITGLTAGDYIKIVFKPAETGGAGTGYITNPGAGHFFVKINTYNNVGLADMIGNHNNARTGYGGWTSPNPPVASTVIDGGVTVANVMTDSIHITTKVLETMAFSVGTQNRDTVNLGSGQQHGKCDAIQQIDNNRLNLGNPNAEFSLETTVGWDVHSYWRLSSNSSGGATVYYSGNTLANTVGDEIAEMPNEVVSTPGTEQFGLGFVDAGLDAIDTGSATWAAGYLRSSSYPFRTLNGQELLTQGHPSDPALPAPQRDFTALATQNASNNYDEATGTLGTSVSPGTAKFRFLKSSLTIPEPIAQQNETVIACATAKMRYVGNIAADTPAGVYTTKINYLAAPQY